MLYSDYNIYNDRRSYDNVYIKLDFESEKPIYTQLMEQIIAGIAKQELLPGERLPSVRSLAADIGVNLHTVNKAYQELKQKGFILSHRQRGVVIHPDGMPPADQEFKDQLYETLHPIIAESIARQLSFEEFTKICRDIFQTYLDKEGD